MRSSLSRLLEFEGTFLAADPLSKLYLFIILYFRELRVRFIDCLFYGMLALSSDYGIEALNMLN
jgi:hypothetical protein